NLRKLFTDLFKFEHVILLSWTPFSPRNERLKGVHAPSAPAGSSAPNAQAGEERGGIAAHKYDGLRTVKERFVVSGVTAERAQPRGIIPLWREALSAGMGQKRADEESIFH